MQQVPLQVLPKHMWNPQSKEPSLFINYIWHYPAKCLPDEHQMYLDVSPARLTWSILRAASSPVHENIGYGAQPTCSCKFFVLPGCETVKRVSYTFSSSSMDVEWLMPKAAPALTSQWQDLTVLSTPPHFHQLTHHMDPNSGADPAEQLGPRRASMTMAGLGNY